VAETATQIVPASFGDVTLEAMSFPNQPTSPEAVRDKMGEVAARYFEDEWINQSLKSLAGLTPGDASASSGCRQGLRGVIGFLAECFLGSAPQLSKKEGGGPLILYDFDRLRRKLGLLTAPPAPAEGAGLNIPAMSTEELAGLNADTLSDEQLTQAFRAALQLDARDLAGHFARKMTGRPAGASTADRYP